MRKILKNTTNTKQYLASLPKIYLVVCWAKYGVREYFFTGKYVNINGISIPLVYDYDDHNGTTDNWYLRRIDHTTAGLTFMWTQSRAVADKIAELLNNNKDI